MNDRLIQPESGDYTVYDARLAALAAVRGVALKGIWVMADDRVYFVYRYDDIKPALLEWRTHACSVPLNDYLDALRSCTATIRRMRRAKAAQ